MPGQNPVVADYYPDQFQTLSFPLHGSTIVRNGLTPLLYVEKRQIVIDDIRLITRFGVASLTIDVGFTPGATPVATWKGTVSTTNSSPTVGIVTTTTGYSASSLGIGDRFYAIAGGVPTNFPDDAYISAVVTAGSSYTINGNATGTSTSPHITAYAVNYKSLLTAPMSAATENTIVVGAINYSSATIPTTAPNNLEVTEANNIVLGPVSPSTLGNVISIEARGAATTNYVGTLQIRYRERVA